MAGPGLGGGSLRRRCPLLPLGGRLRFLVESPALADRRSDHPLISTASISGGTRDRYTLTRVHAKGGIGQAAGGISVDIAIFYGFLLVLVAFGVLFFFGRRRQKRADAERAQQAAARAR